MTPAELAEDLDAGRDLHANVDEFAPLLAAALRLAEKVNALDSDVDGIAILTCAYRSARQRLTRIAP